MVPTKTLFIVLLKHYCRRQACHGRIFILLRCRRGRRLGAMPILAPRKRHDLENAESSTTQNRWVSLGMSNWQVTLVQNSCVFPG